MEGGLATVYVRHTSLDTSKLLPGCHEEQRVPQYAKFTDTSLAVHGGMARYIKHLLTEETENATVCKVY